MSTASSTSKPTNVKALYLSADYEAPKRFAALSCSPPQGAQCQCIQKVHVTTAPAMKAVIQACPLEDAGLGLSSSDACPWVSPDTITTTTARSFAKPLVDAVTPDVGQLRRVEVKRKMSYREASRCLCRYVDLVNRLKREGEIIPEDVWVRCSTLHAILEQYEESRDDALAALEQAGGVLPVANFRLGYALFGMRRFADAAQAFSEGLKHSPGSQDLKHALQVTLRAMRNRRNRITARAMARAVPDRQMTAAVLRAPMERREDPTDAQRGSGEAAKQGVQPEA